MSALDLLFNGIGMAGMACFLIAYFLLQKGSLSSHSAPYLTINLVGSILLLFSLMWDWNLAAFILETAWFFISLWGLYRWRFKRSGT